MQQHAHLQFTTFTSLHFYTAEHSEAVSMSAKSHLLLLPPYILCTTMNSFCTQNQRIFPKLISVNKTTHDSL